MSDKHTPEVEDFQAQVPAWLEPIIRISAGFFAYFLAFGFLLFAGLLTLLILGYTGLPFTEMAKNAMLFLITVGYLASIAANYRSVVPGWTGFGAMLVLSFAMPFALGFLAARGEVAPNDQYLKLVATAVRDLSSFFGFFSVTHLMAVYVYRFMDWRRASHERRTRYIDTSKADTLKPAFIPACWQMSRCRPGVRMTCPNFIDRVPCWKRRSGCYCDRDLANFLIETANAGEAQEAIEMQTMHRLPGMARMRERVKQARKKRSWRVQKKWCYDCQLYLEHQEYKYKHMSWIGFPITAVIVGGVFVFYDMGYKWLAGALEEWMRAMVEGGVLPGMFDPSGSSLAQNFTFELILLGVLSLLVLSYVIQMVDVIFFKWKL